MKFFFLFVSFVSVASAADLTIGCATKCDGFFHRAIRREAREMGHKVKVIDVSSKGPVIDWAALDAVIVPGGADIDPKYYLDSVEPELQAYTRSLDHLVNYSAEGRRRDPVEYALLKEYFSRPDLKSLPVLGVCRGMQMLAVSQGIPLYVDIKAELGIPNRRYLFDRIYPEDMPSLMSELFSQSFLGFKRHHQGVRVDYFQKNKNRWPGITLTAFSNKKLIAEAIEFSDRPVIGVQFHPENDFGFERHRFFQWLLNRAAEWNGTKIRK